MNLFLTGQTEIMSKLSPLIYTAVAIAIIYSFIKSIIEGKFKKMILQVIICAVVAYMAHDPNSLFMLGNFIVNTATGFGGDILGY
ncbi:MAG: hypothetical protein ABF289_17775 [Clostridiales bacterium]